jgi:hypothetical protein
MEMPLAVSEISPERKARLLFDESFQAAVPGMNVSVELLGVFAGRRASRAS